MKKCTLFSIKTVVMASVFFGIKICHADHRFTGKILKISFTKSVSKPTKGLFLHNLPDSYNIRITNDGQIQQTKWQEWEYVPIDLLGEKQLPISQRNQKTDSMWTYIRWYLNNGSQVFSIQKDGDNIVINPSQPISQSPSKEFIIDETKVILYELKLHSSSPQIGYKISINDINYEGYITQFWDGNSQGYKANLDAQNKPLIGFKISKEKSDNSLINLLRPEVKGKKMAEYLLIPEMRDTSGALLIPLPI